MRRKLCRADQDDCLSLLGVSRDLAGGDLDTGLKGDNAAAAMSITIRPHDGRT